MMHLHVDLGDAGSAYAVDDESKWLAANSFAVGLACSSPLGGLVVRWHRRVRRFGLHGRVALSGHQRRVHWRRSRGGGPGVGSPSELDPKTLALVRLARGRWLVARCRRTEPRPSWVNAGRRPPRSSGARRGVPVVGLPCVVAAAPKLAMALGTTPMARWNTSGWVTSATRRADRSRSPAPPRSLCEETPSFDRSRRTGC